MILKLLSAIIILCCSLTAQTAFISSLNDTTIQCDYLIISPQQFSAEALLLAQHRNAFTRDSVHYAKVTLLEDILSEFGDSTGRTNVLHKGIYQALTHWKKPSLKYIVLIGDDSAAFNAKDSVFYSAGRMPSWIKTFPNDSAELKFVSELQRDYNFLRDMADTFNFNYTLIPNVSIGRIPCESKEQLSAYISKVIDFDTTSNFDNWRNRVLSIADDNVAKDVEAPMPTPFQEIADDFADTLRGYHYKKIYLSGFKLDTNFMHSNARQALIKELNNNYFLTIYNGHGAPDKLTDESVLTSDDCDNINNTRPGIFLSFSCEGAVFDKPIKNSILKKLLFSKGGFVCIIGSSSISFLSYGITLGSSMVSTLTRNDNVSIGKCMSTNKHTFDNYTLIGDPAIIVKGNSLPSTASGNNSQLKITSSSTNPVHYYYSISKPEHVKAFPNGSDFDYDSIVFSDSGTFSGEVRCNYPALPDTGYSITLYLWDDFGNERNYLLKPDALNPIVSSLLQRIGINDRVLFDKRNIIIHQGATGTASFNFILYDLQGRTVVSRSGTIQNKSIEIPFDAKNNGNKYYVWKLTTGNLVTNGRLVITNH